MDVWIVCLLLAAVLGVAELFDPERRAGPARRGRGRHRRCGGARCSGAGAAAGVRRGVGDVDLAGAARRAAPPARPADPAVRRRRPGRAVRAGRPRDQQQRGTVRIDGEAVDRTPLRPARPGLRHPGRGDRPRSWPSAAPPRSCIPRSRGRRSHGTAADRRARRRAVRRGGAGEGRADRAAGPGPQRGSGSAATSARSPPGSTSSCRSSTACTRPSTCASRWCPSRRGR